MATLNSQSSFNKTLVLANTAYDIALTIRSVETFGISSRASGSVSSTGYGINFVKGKTDSFLLFADTSGGASCAGQAPTCKPGNGVYSAGSDVLVQTYTLGNGMTISDFCAGSSCASGSLATMDIVFTRPNPTPSVNGSVSSACIKVVSPQGGAKYISIASSGAISANAASCP